MATDKKQYDRLHMCMVEILAERNISKTRICKDLDIEVGELIVRVK